MFFMLILVMAANYPLLFVGWEGVGLSSYLLIGFYFLRRSAADAGKKAFVVNRIGDFGFMLAMFLIFRTFNSLDFATVFSRASEMHADALGELGLATVIGLLLFMGAVGKSAQIPLYVWLPDAMEGPTPVSALIHAATMVTAGVYVVARSHVLFLHSPSAMLVVAVVGCGTAFFAATIGLVQTDIKKVLAYSTISQLGYMFLACGVGSFTAGIFHLMTHAFFKALLFLAAGSVIHAIGGEQDMRKMGGLRRQIPWTYGTMLMATLAIAGAPGFSGFFSKDAILMHAFESPTDGRWLYGLGLFSALLTAFYMFRLLFLSFHGAPRYDEHRVHVHESPRSMLFSLVVLAVLSVAGGWVALPAFFGGVDRFEAFLRPVMGEASPVESAAVGANSLELTLAAVAVAASLTGFLVAWWFYLRRADVPERLSRSVRGLYVLLVNKYYVDEIYSAVIVRPLVWFSTRVLWYGVDEGVIDGSVNGIAQGTQAIGERVRRVQSGNTRSYAAWVVVGAVLVIGLLLWPLLRPALGMVH
jgi:NADH-quinone oxidoreductase subunit L